jgi:PPM family protein phosphatase
MRVYCPHCITPCLVADQHVGYPVACYKCKQAFTAQPPSSASASSLPRTNPVSATVVPPRLDIGCATTTGHVADRNEDSFLVLHQAWSNSGERHELAMLAVADGLGGHAAGDEASGLAIRALGSTLAPLLGGALSGQFKDPAAPVLGETIDFAIQEANRAVFRKSQSSPACKGMGATLALALVWDNQVLIGHVGDCRVYHQHQGRLTQVTKDQTLVARMVELGQLTSEEAKSHPSRNQITQALGNRFDVKPAAHRLTLAEGDWLVLACDGLHAHVDAPDLQSEITDSPSASHLANQLVDMANDDGGSDNCTVVAAYCT